jgi:hypothetical protein
VTNLVEKPLLTTTLAGDGRCSNWAAERLLATRKVLSTFSHRISADRQQVLHNPAGRASDWFNMRTVASQGLSNGIRLLSYYGDCLEKGMRIHLALEPHPIKEHA